MGQFQTTRWSLIATAARESPSLAREALEQLCRAYRPPVVAYLRRDGHAPADAEDLAQAFFVRFIERGWYRDADPERGRFRSLLLTALRVDYSWVGRHGTVVYYLSLFLSCCGLTVVKVFNSCVR